MSPENRQTMASLAVIIMLVLQFAAGISGETSFIYSRPGDAAIMSCGSDRTWSEVSWFYCRDGLQTVTEVANGKVEQSSSRAARLSLDASCSLVIKNITTEDAGYYSCQQDGNIHHDTYLSVLTVSRSPADEDPNRNGEVTLQCRLFGHVHLHPSEQISIQWVDDKGTVLRPTQVRRMLDGQINYMSSVLNVTRQSFYNSRYTCQVVDQRDKNNVKIEAAITGDTRDVQPETSEPVPSDQPWKCTWTLRVGGLILMIVATVCLIIIKGKAKRPGDDNNVHVDVNEVVYENEAPPDAATLV